MTPFLVTFLFNLLSCLLCYLFDTCDAGGINPLIGNV